MHSSLSLKLIFLCFTSFVWGKSLSRVTSTSTFPYSAIGRFEEGCSGVLIGPRHVLTAAHCVYHNDYRGWTEDLTFTPGQNGRENPFGKVGAKKALIPPSWEKENRELSDIALVVLDADIGNKTGWLGYGIHNNLSQSQVKIVGYPGKKTSGTLWESQCPLLNIFTQWLDYECETEEGMSGSPIIRFVPETQNNLVVGIHSLGGPQYNSGVRISPRIYRQIEQWKNQYP